MALQVKFRSDIDITRANAVTRICQVEVGRSTIDKQRIKENIREDVAGIGVGIGGYELAESRKRIICDVLAVAEEVAVTDLSIGAVQQVDSFSAKCEDRAIDDRTG
jgi:hypothetical protein